jgi:hypothetical protein
MTVCLLTNLNVYVILKVQFTSDLYYAYIRVCYGNWGYVTVLVWDLVLYYVRLAAKLKSGTSPDFLHLPDYTHLP